MKDIRSDLNSLTLNSTKLLKNTIKTQKLFTYFHDLLVACTSRRFHHYRSFWKPKIHHQLTVKAEKGNLHNPFSCLLSVKSKSKINGSIVVGHLSSEICRFCKFFPDYGGVLQKRLHRAQSTEDSPSPKEAQKFPYICKFSKDDCSF